jgi:hypothetical protein
MSDRPGGSWWRWVELALAAPWIAGLLAFLGMLVVAGPGSPGGEGAPLTSLLAELLLGLALVLAVIIGPTVAVVVGLLRARGGWLLASGVVGMFLSLMWFMGAANSGSVTEATAGWNNAVAVAFLVALPATPILVVVRLLNGRGRHREPATKAAPVPQATAPAVPANAPAFPAGGAPAGTLRVTRKHQPFALWARRLEVEIDGRRVASLAEGESVDVRLSGGSHELRVRLAGSFFGLGRNPSDSTGVRIDEAAVTHLLVSLTGNALLYSAPGSYAGPGYWFDDGATADPGRPFPGRPLPLRKAWLSLGGIAVIGIAMGSTYLDDGRSLLDHVPFVGPAILLVLLFGVPTVLVVQVRRVLAAVIARTGTGRSIAGRRE